MSCILEENYVTGRDMVPFEGYLSHIIIIRITLIRFQKKACAAEILIKQNMHPKGDPETAGETIIYLGGRNNYQIVLIKT